MYLSQRAQPRPESPVRRIPRSEAADIMPLPTRRSSDPAPDLVHAFAPLHKAAFGAAIGTACALLAFGITALALVRPPDPPVPLYLFNQYFTGYSVTWPGALVGAAWGWVTGFVFGWFTAFCRNFVLAISLFIIRTRADLARTRDFLDHV